MSREALHRMYKYEIGPGQLEAEAKRLNALERKSRMDIAYVIEETAGGYNVFVVDYAKPHKGFPERHPNLPLVVAVIALIGSIIAPLLR